MKYFPQLNHMNTYVLRQPSRQLNFAFIFPHITHDLEIYGASSKGKLEAQTDYAKLTHEEYPMEGFINTQKCIT